MTAYVLRRVAQGVVVLWLVSVVTFFLIHMAPGGPSSAVSFERTAEEREALLRQYGLDKPVLTRYVTWLAAAVQGDLGSSYNQGLPVARLLGQRLPNTLTLGFTALLLATVLGVVLGVLAAVYRNRWPDHLVGTLATLGMSIPGFWLGIVAIIVFAVELQWLPGSGIVSPGRDGGGLGDRLQHLAMPAGVLAFTLMPNVVRVTRSALLETIRSDFVRTARSKGLSPTTVLVKHAFKNALVPVLAVLGLITTVLFSGSVVIESVFGWPGLGRLAIEAANGRDYPVILGATLLAGMVVVSVNLLVDMLYAVVDPRIRHE